MEIYLQTEDEDFIKQTDLNYKIGFSENTELISHFPQNNEIMSKILATFPQGEKYTEIFEKNGITFDDVLSCSDYKELVDITDQRIKKVDALRIYKKCKEIISNPILITFNLFPITIDFVMNWFSKQVHLMNTERKNYFTEDKKISFVESKRNAWITYIPLVNRDEFRNEILSFYDNDINLISGARHESDIKSKRKHFTILGAPGIGKTRISEECSQFLKERGNFIYLRANFSNSDSMPLLDAELLKEINLMIGLRIYYYYFLYSRDRMICWPKFFETLNMSPYCGINLFTIENVICEILKENNNSKIIIHLDDIQSISRFSKMKRYDGNLLDDLVQILARVSNSLYLKDGTYIMPIISGTSNKNEIKELFSNDLSSFSPECKYLSSLKYDDVYQKIFCDYLSQGNGISDDMRDMVKGFYNHARSICDFISICVGFLKKNGIDVKDVKSFSKNLDKIDLNLVKKLLIPNISDKIEMNLNEIKLKKFIRLLCFSNHLFDEDYEFKIDNYKIKFQNISDWYAVPLIRKEMKGDYYMRPNIPLLITFNWFDKKIGKYAWSKSLKIIAGKEWEDLETMIEIHKTKLFKCLTMKTFQLCDLYQGSICENKELLKLELIVPSSNKYLLVKNIDKNFKKEFEKKSENEKNNDGKIYNTGDDPTFDTLRVLKTKKKNYMFIMKQHKICQNKIVIKSKDFLKTINNERLKSLNTYKKIIVDLELKDEVDCNYIFIFMSNYIVENFNYKELPERTLVYCEENIGIYIGENIKCLID